MKYFENLAYEIEYVAETKCPKLVAKGKEIDLLIKHNSWETALGQNEQFIYLSKRLPNQNKINDLKINNLLNRLVD